jgi:protein-tyrosine phosphatase
VGFVDLHSHVLPGLDDGAPDPETSMAMISGLADLGFDTIAATPHQKAGQFLPTREAIDQAYAGTRERVSAAGVPVTLALAAENMWDEVFYERSEAGTIPSYDGGPAFLVEFPLTHLPPGLTEVIFRLRSQARLPVIAHPERYPDLWSDTGLVERLGADCALVVDLGAVAGYHGRKRAKAARSWLKNGLIHAVASDAHSAGDVRIAAEGIGWIRKKLGEGAVTRLLDDNPRRILSGEHPDG